MMNRPKRKRKGFAKALRIVIIVIIFIALYALSWVITVGVIKLITLCFSWKFSLLYATGIWLILCMVKLLFPGTKGS